MFSYSSKSSLHFICYTDASFGSDGIIDCLKISIWWNKLSSTAQYWFPYESCYLVNSINLFYG